jgi:hypothetical protein
MNPVWFDAGAAIRFHTTPTAISPRFMLTHMGTLGILMKKAVAKLKSPITRGWSGIIEKCGSADPCVFGPRGSDRAFLSIGKSGKTPGVLVRQLEQVKAAEAGLEALVRRGLEVPDFIIGSEKVEEIR